MALRRRDLLTLALALAACRRRGDDDARAIRFLHQPLWGDPAPFASVLDGFRAADRELPLETRLAPSASDALHQYLLTSLEAGADLDVIVVDAIWVAEFARAGWIADLSDVFPPDVVRRDFLPGAADAVVVGGRTWAIPWWVDVGVLYARTDLVEPPRTYAALEAEIARARAGRPDLGGHLWQGRQYEGLVCNAYEAIWGHGGATMRDERLELDVDAARAALAWLASLPARGLSPPLVTTAAEEECRRSFQSGRALFMRNWPYAWAELQSPASPVRGRVGLLPLPSIDGAPGPGTLGGWQLAIAAHVPAWKRPRCAALVAHLASEAAQATMARAYGRLPSRRASYRDPQLLADVPVLATLASHVERARPRPVTPWYPMISDVLQGELSAIVSGIRSPAAGLARAQRQIDRLMGIA